MAARRALNDCGRRIYFIRQYRGRLVDGSGNWLIGVAVGLLVGGSGSLLAWSVLRPRDEARAGIEALAGASWREFLNLVLAALASRGYRRTIDRETASGDADFTLEREGRTWLLSCKHARSYVLGKPSVEHLANDIRLAGAAGGFLVTQGTILEEAREPARRHGIELLGSDALWSELREFIKPSQRAGINAAANALARRRILLSWLLAVLAGIAAWTLLPEEPAPVPAPASAAPAPLGAARDTPEVEAEPLQPTLSLEQQRDAVARAVATLPEVTHALWTTRSTLEVHLASTDGDAAAAICQIVEGHPDLAASRIQLTPPAGSGGQVRFRQCRAY